MTPENRWLYGPALSARARRGFAALLNDHARRLREGGDLSPSAAAAALEDVRLLLERLVPQQKHWSAIAVSYSQAPQPAACTPTRFCTAFSATAAQALHVRREPHPGGLEGRYEGCVTAPGPLAGGTAVLQICVDGTQPHTANSLLFSVASCGLTRTFHARPQTLVALDHDDCGRHTIRVEGEGTVTLQDSCGEKTCRGGSAVLILRPSADGKKLLRVFLRDSDESFDTGEFRVCKWTQRFSHDSSQRVNN